RVFTTAAAHLPHLAELRALKHGKSDASDDGQAGGRGWLLLDDTAGWMLQDVHAIYAYLPGLKRLALYGNLNSAAASEEFLLLRTGGEMNLGTLLRPETFADAFAKFKGLERLLLTDERMRDDRKVDEYVPWLVRRFELPEVRKRAAEVLFRRCGGGLEQVRFVCGENWAVFEQRTVAVEKFGAEKFVVEARAVGVLRMGCMCGGMGRGGRRVRGCLVLRD
ncbi:hypothetical protein N0V88_007403, partial [Collariella sp. IMI 366227]